MSAFSGDDYEFAVGAIQGVRSWSIDDFGRLHGVSHREVWRPGENVAVCKKAQRVRQGTCPEFARLTAQQSGRKGRRRDEFSLVYSTFNHRCGDHCDGMVHWKEPAKPHTFDPECQCGFWAYNEYDFTEHGDVTGIIEGYGRTTVGTKGFRCEKARIVALCREREESTLNLSTWLRLQALYPEAKFFATKDEMVTAFGGVMKTWDAVDDDFWNRPVPRAEDTFSALSAYMSRVSASLGSSFWQVQP